MIKWFAARMGGKHLALTICSFACFASSSCVDGQAGTQTIAVKGMVDSTTGASFDSIAPTQHLTDAGDVVFSGRLVGDGVTSANQLAVWRLRSDGTRELVVRSGDIDLSTGAAFREVAGVDVGNDGSIVLNGRLTGPGVNAENDRGIWTEVNGDLQLMIRAGSPAPGADDTYLNFGPSSLRDGSTVVFSASLRNSQFDNSLWRVGPSGQPVLLAKELGAAPGANDLYGRFNGHTVNKLGRVALVASFSDVLNNGYGLWSEGATDGLKLVTRSGNLAPGTTAQFDQFGPSYLGDDGHLSFLATLQTGGGVNGLNSNGIWSDRKGSGLAMEYRAGVSRDPATRGLFTNFDRLEVNAKGAMAFRGIAANRGGVWSEGSDGVLRLVAEDRTQAPGTSLVFSQNFYNFSVMSFNGMGQMAFQAVVTDPTMPRPRSYNGIWAQDVLGALRLIAIEGDYLDVSDNPASPDWRQIQTLTFQRTGFNDLGQLTFHAQFTDGSSGIFLSTAVAVPEPLSVAAPIVAALFVQRFRRQRATRQLPASAK